MQACPINYDEAIVALTSMVEKIKIGGEKTLYGLELNDRGYFVAKLIKFRLKF